MSLPPRSVLWWRVCTKQGEDCGVWSGTTPAAAVAAMLRVAGLAVHAKGGELVYEQGEERRAGELADWDVQPLKRGLRMPRGE